MHKYNDIDRSSVRLHSPNAITYSCPCTVESSRTSNKAKSLLYGSYFNRRRAFLSVYFQSVDISQKTEAHRQLRLMFLSQFT